MGSAEITACWPTVSGAMPAADGGISRIAHVDDIDALAAETVPHTVGVATDGRDEEAGARPPRVDPPTLRIQQQVIDLLVQRHQRLIALGSAAAGRDKGLDLLQVT